MKSLFRRKNKKNNSIGIGQVSKREKIRQYTIQYAETSPKKTIETIKKLEQSLLKDREILGYSKINEIKAELSALYRIRQIQNKL